MARDRKKAKARRARQERQQRSGSSRNDQQRQPRPSEAEPDLEPTAEGEPEPEAASKPRPTGYDPLGPLGHASGDLELAEEAEEGLPVDEVDPPSGDDEKARIYPDELTDDASGHGIMAQLVDRDEDLGIDEDEVDPELDKEAEAAVKATGRESRRAAPKGEKREGNRVFAFLRACWAELQRVQWPDRRAVAQATAVVLGFVVIAGSFLGLMDFIWAKVITALLDL
jgi:preprotein translocase SecE subunit